MEDIRIGFSVLLGSVLVVLGLTVLNVAGLNMLYSVLMLGAAFIGFALYLDSGKTIGWKEVGVAVVVGSLLAVALNSEARVLYSATVVMGLLFMLPFILIKLREKVFAKR